MRVIEFRIDGVHGKGRPRFGKGRMYTDRQTREYEEYVGWLAKNAIKDPLTGPVWIDIKIYLVMPRTWSKAKREKERNWPCAVVPDVDNVAKAICDALDGIAYSDDRQICRVTATKEWGQTAGVRVRLGSMRVDQM